MVRDERSDCLCGEDRSVIFFGQLFQQIGLYLHKRHFMY